MCYIEPLFSDFDQASHVLSKLCSVQNGTADAASMFADDIYAAGLCHGLELSAGESHNGVGKLLALSLNFLK